MSQHAFSSSRSKSPLHSDLHQSTRSTAARLLNRLPSHALRFLASDAAAVPPTIDIALALSPATLTILIASLSREYTLCHSSNCYSRLVERRPLFFFFSRQRHRPFVPSGHHLIVAWPRWLLISNGHGPTDRCTGSDGAIRLSAGACSAGREGATLLDSGSGTGNGRHPLACTKGAVLTWGRAERDVSVSVPSAL